MSLLAKVKEKLSKSDISEEDAFIKRIERRNKLLDRLVERLSTLSTFLFIAGLCYMLAIPADPLGKALRVSENAIQAGQVTTYWDWQDVFVADKYAQDVQSWSQLLPKNRADYIQEAFADIGLPASTQDYSLDSRTYGTNSYAVLHAPKTDGAEALVLGASWLSREEGRVNTRGIALLLGLAKYLSKHAMWSKDIIFLVSDGYTEGADAWISAYHGEQVEGVASLDLTTGAIWAALNVDYPHHSFKNIGFYFSGVNGNLPNLDFLAAVSHITRFTGGVTPLVYNSSEAIITHRGPKGFFSHPLVKQYRAAASSVWQQIYWQALGAPSGPEGVYSRFRIDAMALFAIPAENPHGFFALGKITEASLRALNNLLERFHASAFLYLLTSPRRFVPLAHYIAAPLLCGIALTLRGVWLWIKASRARRGLVAGEAEAAATHLLSLCFAAVIGYMVLSFRTFGLSAMVLASVAASALPILLTICLTGPPFSLDDTAPVVQYLPASLNLLAGMLVSVFATVNFSMACFSSICLGLSVLLGKKSTRSSHRWLRIGVLLATSLPCIPLTLAVACNPNLLQNVGQSAGVWFGYIMVYAVQWHFLGLAAS